KKEQSERTLGVIPRFGTTDRMNAPPLKPGAKFKLFAKTSFDPAILALAVVQAGVSQADNQFRRLRTGSGGLWQAFRCGFCRRSVRELLRQFLLSDPVPAGPSLFPARPGRFHA